MPPYIAASQEAHKQPVWANQVVRPRLWDAACQDALQDPLGPVSQNGCLSVGTVEFCHGWSQGFLQAVPRAVMSSDSNQGHPGV